MGCLTVLAISQGRDDLIQKLERRFCWVSDFSELESEDYEDIVNMTEDIWTFMAEMEEER
jgi:hypothetical protein